jgi:uncharacterized protein YecE (DUF72 family)
VTKEFFPNNFKNKSRLHYYSSTFNTVEINSTFKKIPRHSTFDKWCNDVPEHFQFTIKISNEITHAKNLGSAFPLVKSFITAANHLKNRKGCLLIQLPGRVTSEYRQNVEKIILNIHKADIKTEWRKAIEFRSMTWYTERTRNFLNRHRIALVLHDMAKSTNLQVDRSSSFYYFRFHGPAGDYKGSYSNKFLEEQALKISDCLNHKKDVYAYFNNTMGNAFENALTLKTKFEKLFS